MLNKCILGILTYRDKLNTPNGDYKATKNGRALVRTL